MIKLSEILSLRTLPSRVITAWIFFDAQLEPPHLDLLWKVCLRDFNTYQDEDKERSQRAPPTWRNLRWKLRESGWWGWWAKQQSSEAQTAAGWFSWGHLWSGRFLGRPRATQFSYRIFGTNWYTYIIYIYIYTIYTYIIVQLDRFGSCSASLPSFQRKNSKHVQARFSRLAPPNETHIQSKKWPFSACLVSHSAQLHGVLIQEGVGRQLQVLRSGSLSHASSIVIVWSVARAEVATIASCIWLWNAAQVGAHTNANQPLWFLAPLCICGRISHGWGNRIILPCCSNLLRCALADKHRLGTPLHGEVLPHTNGAEVHLHNTSSKHILGWPKRKNQLARNCSDERSRNHCTCCSHEVHKGATICMTNGKAIGSKVQGALWNSACWHGCILSQTNRSEVLWRELGNGHNGRLLGIIPNIRSGDCGTWSKLALGKVWLPRESWLTNGVVMGKLQVSLSHKLVKIIRGLDEFSSVMNNRMPHSLLCLFFIFFWSLHDELILVHGLLGRWCHLIIVTHQVRVCRLSKASRL